jgi:L-lactate dehydrogenase complex protein LldG
MTREETIQRFMKNATAVAADAVRVKSREELNEVLGRILSGDGTIYCPAVTDLEKAAAVPAERRSDDYRTAGICVEEVLAAIAETGSLVCSSVGGKPVQAGLLATHHVALVDGDRVHEQLDDFFSTCGDSPPTNFVLETGPSRTADIELTLTIGVHGPGRLSIIVVS